MKNFSSPLLICLMFVLLTSPVFSQAGFQRMYGGPSADISYYAFPSPAGGIYLMGATLTYGSGSADPMLMRLDDDGQVIWSKAYGEANYDVANAMMLSSDGGVVLAGSTRSFNGNTLDDVYLFKTDSSGNLLWSETFSSPDLELASSVIQTSDGGYALSGYERSTGSKRVLLIRTDANGDTLFIRSFGQSNDDVGVSLCETPDGGFIIVGKTFAQTLGESDILMMRTDSAGNLLWTKSFGDVWWDEAGFILPLSDGNYIITGATISFGSGNFDILVLKTDSAGNLIWGRTYGGIHLEASYCAYENTDGSLVISGYTNSLGYGHALRQGPAGLEEKYFHPFPETTDDRGDDSTNVFLMKLDSTGDTLWTRVYGDGKLDEGFRFSKMPDGGYLLPGYTDNYTYPTDSTQIILIRTDTLGFSGCHERSAFPILDTTNFITQTLAYTEASNLVQSAVVTQTVSYADIAEDACLYLEVIDQHSPATRLYPNPCVSYFEVEGLSAGSKVELYDLAGKKVLNTLKIPMGSGNRVDVSSLDPGCYLVRIIHENILLTKKIIIQNN